MTNEYKYVPVVPTDEMQDAAYKAAKEHHYHSISDMSPLGIYKAMLAAAPAQSEPAESLDSPDKETREAIRNEALDELINKVRDSAGGWPIFLQDIEEFVEDTKTHPAQPSDSQAEVSDTEKDAARYRWLRNNSADKFYGGSDKAPAVFNVDDEFNHGPEDHLEGEDLDKAVDAAKKAQEQS